MVSCPELPTKKPGRWSWRSATTDVMMTEEEEAGVVIVVEEVVVVEDIVTERRLHQSIMTRWMVQSEQQRLLNMFLI